MLDADIRILRQKPVSVPAQKQRHVSAFHDFATELNEAGEYRLEAIISAWRLHLARALAA